MEARAMQAGVVALGRVFEGWRSRDQHRDFLCCTHVRPERPEGQQQL